ncbi:hypothetical protein CCH79_00015680 [Gambusia affinis]|uniref:PIH1 domain-containing protein 1 n=1 Tax=Gambusia affinis TaxID=33528 RepID=A0A315WG17_GAMAF|nr:hypothetical protein CCH79_00015680 [Gambusia affinis]
MQWVHVVSACGSPRLIGTLYPLGSSDWSSCTSSSLESSGGGGTEVDWQMFMKTFCLSGSENVFTQRPGRRRERRSGNESTKEEKAKGNYKDSKLLVDDVVHFLLLERSTVILSNRIRVHFNRTETQTSTVAVHQFEVRTLAGEVSSELRSDESVILSLSSTLPNSFDSILPMGATTTCSQKPDESGELIRVGGRLCRAEDLTFCNFHPMVLDPSNPVTKLLIQDCDRLASRTRTNSQGCTAYDVVINQDFFQKSQRSKGSVVCDGVSQKDPLFQQFVILVSVEGLENKYSLELNRDWKVLKNRKFLGSVSEQNIRTKSRPVIQELQPQPECLLLVEPPTGHPEYLIAEIKLPGVSSSRSLVLDVGEDRLLLTARPSLYHLDIFHPFLVDQQNSVAQYNKSTQILTVTMPVGSSTP